MARIVAVHGAATTATAWAGVARLLPGHEFHALERPRTGDWQAELSFVAEHAAGAWVLGFSGGATLGLGLAASAVPLAGAVLHEPAVGSLAPGLLGPFADALSRGGPAAFGKALYGPSWTLPEGPAGAPDVLRAELAMFGGFEPEPPAPTAGRVLVTYGGTSPRPRHLAAEALQRRLGYDIQALPGCGHFVVHDRPEVFAGAVAELVGGPPGLEVDGKWA